MQFMIQFVKAKVQSIILAFLRPLVHKILLTDVLVWGPKDRLIIGKNVHLVNTLCNTSSGTITIGDHAFSGHNVMLITGSHDVTKTNQMRQSSIVEPVNNIVIGTGVWVGTGAIILGPCTIGNNAVIAAGSVIKPNTIVPDNTIFAGVPAVEKKRIA